MKMRVSDVQFGEIKAATQMAIHRLYGLANAAMVCRAEKTALHEYQSINHPDRVIPLDIALQLDTACGEPISAIYGALWRAARALGWRRLITYTLQSESGASLRGAGWTVLAERKANDPAQWQSRPGREWQSVVGQAKILWSAA